MANTIQRELSGSNPRVVTESQLVKSGQGVIRGIVVTATSSGTLKIYDALEGGSAATGTLTSSGAMVPASHGQTKLTSNGTNVTAGKVMVVGAKTYTFKAAAAVDGEITIGENAAATLDNVKAAINGTDGINTAHPFFIATTNADTTQIITARIVAGTTATNALNALATTTDEATLSWADTTYGGGTGDSNPAVTTAGATVTIGSVTYTGVVELSETSGATAVPYQILWITSEAVFLDNLKAGVNGLGTAGTTYSTGTEAHPQVLATTNSATQQVFVSKTIGTAGNSIATTETLANYAWGATTLASGTGTTGTLIMDTFTPAAGASFNLYNCEFNNGLYITVGGTSISASVFYK